MKTNRSPETIVNEWVVPGMIVGLSLLMWFVISPPTALPLLVAEPKWRLEPVNDLAIPGVHGAILSVLIPVIAAYAIFVGGTRRQFEQAVFDAANVVNEINAPAFVTDHMPLPGLDGYTNEEKSEFISRFQQLVVYGAMSNQPVSKSDGIEVLAILSGFLNSAPFNAKIKRNDPSNVEILAGRVTFRAISDVQSWAMQLGSAGVVCAMALNRADRFRQLVFAAVDPPETAELLVS